MEGEEEEGEGAATTSRQQQQKLRGLAPMLKRRGGSPLSPLVGIFRFEKGEQPNGGGRQRGSASLPTGFGFGFERNSFGCVCKPLLPVAT